MHELHAPQNFGNENPLTWYLRRTCISYVMIMMASVFLIIQAIPNVVIMLVFC